MSPSYQYTTTRPQSCGCEEEQTSCGAVQGTADAQNSCGCQNNCGCDCECQGCCPPVAEEADVDCGCGCDCASGLLGVLQLLGDACFSSLIDYERFVFVTDHFVLGSSLCCPDEVDTPYDNLTGPLAGELTEVSENTCRRLGVSGQIFYAQPVCATACCPDGPGFDVSELSLCSVRAIAFGPIEEPVPAPADPEYLSPFQRTRSLLFRALHPGCPVRPITARPTPFGGSVPCTGLDCRRTISLTAGPLLLGNVLMLGRLGDAYVLANDESQRFYIVCADAIDFVG